jgi:hypothetical protein
LPADHADRIKSDTDNAKKFKPTPKMLAYLFATRKLTASGKPYSQRVVAAAADVHEDVVARWHRVSGFDEWFSREVRGEFDRLLPLADLSLVRRAIQTGDPRDVEMAHRVADGLTGGVSVRFGDQDPLPDERHSSYVLNLLVPRPEMPVVGPR